MKVKMSLELAEDLGLIPEVDPWIRNGLTVRHCSEALYSRRTKERNAQYKVDDNYMVEVERLP